MITAKMIRQMWKPVGKRQPCAICGKYENITEINHLIPVARVASFLANVSFYDLIKYETDTGDKIPIAGCWMCPNHHSIWHLLVDVNGDARKDFTQRLLELRLDKEDTNNVCAFFDNFDQGECLVGLVFYSVKVENYALENKK